MLNNGQQKEHECGFSYKTKELEQN